MSTLRSALAVAIGVTVGALFFGVRPAKAQVDLRVLKFDNVSTTLTLGGTPVSTPAGCASGTTCWIWTLSVTNQGTTPAVFGPGVTILTDQLPTSNISYSTNPPPGAPPTPPPTLTPITPLVNNFNGISLADQTTLQNSCSMTGNAASYILSCKVPAGTSVTVPAGASFDISFSAFPNATGAFINPAPGGVGCSIDPGNVVEPTPPVTHPSGKICNEGVNAEVDVAQPDLKITKSDNVNHSSPGGTWIWALTVSNSGGRVATFQDGQLILTDALPQAPGPVTYSLHSPPITIGPGLGGTGVVVCSISVSSVLTCSAVGGTITMAPGVAAFQASIDAVVTVPGTYTNPAGLCQVDPSNFVPEELSLSDPTGAQETNNLCNPDPVTFGPDLSSPKTNDTGGIPVNLGGSFNWTITVKNTGPTAANFNMNDKILVDDLPINGTYTVTTANPFGVTCSISANTVTCIAPTALSIPGNSQFTVNISATPLVVGVFANPRSGGICMVDPDGKITELNENNNTCSDQVTVIGPDLLASKTDSVSNVGTVGGPFTWTITLSNFGTGTATFNAGQAILSDTLPNTNITYGATVTVTNFVGISASDQATLLTSCTFSSPNVVTCTVPVGKTVAIPVGARFDVSFSATPNKTGSFANPTGGVCQVDPNNVIKESNEGNNGCSDIVVVTAPDLTAVKVDSVNHNGTLGVPFTWTITVGNASGASSAPAVFTTSQNILTDSLPSTNITYGPLTVGNFVGISAADQAVLLTSCSFTSPNIVTCKVPAGQTVTLPPGSHFDVSFTATPNATGPFVNPTGGVCQVDPSNVVKENDETNNGCSDTVNVTGPNLIPTKTDSTGGVGTPGTPFTWKISVANASGAFAAPAVFTSGQVILIDTLPTTNVTYGVTVTVGSFVNIAAVDMAVLQTSCSFTSSNVVTCKVPAGMSVTLPVNSSFVVSFTATPTATGLLVNPTGGVCAVDPGNVIPETNELDNACTDTLTVTGAILTAVKTDSVNHTGALNVPFTWTIAVTNGPGSPIPAVFTNGQTVLIDNLPAGATYGSPTVVLGAGITGSVNCGAIVSNNLTCTAVGTLTIPVGASFNVSFSAKPTVTGALVNPASGGICEVDPNNVVEPPATGKNCGDTVTIPPPTGTPSIKISKSFNTDPAHPDTVAPGAITTVTFSVINTGTTPLTGIAFTDTLPDHFTATGVPPPALGVSSACNGTNNFTLNPHSLALMGGSLAVGDHCDMVVTIQADSAAIVGPNPIRVCDTTSAVTSDQISSAPAFACVTIGSTVVNPTDIYQVLYFSNLSKADSYINITNTGALNGFDPAGQICVNVYTFDPSEELISCCSCLVTPDGLKSISVQQDLVTNRLTAALPDSVVVKLVANAPDPGLCNAALPQFQNLTGGMLAWGTTIHQNPASIGGFGITERAFTKSQLSPTELSKLTSLCGFTQAIGSGFGICASCRLGGLGGAQK